MIGLSLLVVVICGNCFSDETGIIRHSEEARSEKPHESHTIRSLQFERDALSSKTHVIGRPRSEMANHEFRPGSLRYGQMGIKSRFSLQQFSEGTKLA